MIKLEHVFIVVLILVLMSVIVYAVGSSTGGSSGGSGSSSSAAGSSINTSSEKNDEETVNQSTPSTTQTEAETVDCEGKSTRIERIQCRLEKRGIEFDVTEESCRGLPNPNNCQSLYNKVASCYDMNGIQKDQCFKRVAGFLSGNVKDEASANNKGAIRNYIVFLLYDLQEKVEDVYNEGGISSEDAASLIDLIVETKQAVMLNETKETIKPLIDRLKNEWRLKMQ